MKKTVGEWVHHIDNLLAVEKEISDQFMKSIVAIGEALLDAKSELNLDDYNGMIQLSGLGVLSRSDIGEFMTAAIEEKRKSEGKKASEEEYEE